MRIEIEPGDDMVAAIRSADAESVVVVVRIGNEALEQAMHRSAIRPLAIERAPACRINAIFFGESADAGDVDAAAAFLESARSTTGQIIDLL